MQATPGIGLVNNLTTPSNSSGKELGRARLACIIERGRARGHRVIDYVTHLMPKDYIVRGSALEFTAATDMNRHSGIALRFPEPTTGEMLESVMHRHALVQACGVLEMPVRWVDKLWALKDPEDKEPYGRVLLLTDLSQLFRRVKDRFLLRSVSDVTRGFLSDTYKRLDSAPLVEAFAMACQEMGLVPCEGYVSDTKIGIQAIKPHIYEPIAGEYMAYGVDFQNSDFGNGAMKVSIFILRLMSGTGVIGNSGLRRIHLGKRLEDDITWSDATRVADIELARSQVRDLVRFEMSDERLQLAQEAISAAATTKLGGDETIVAILKKYLTKGELEKVLARYNSPDVEALPPGNTLWRLSSAISWFGTQQTDEEKSLDMQRIAGKLLPGLTKDE